MTRKTTRTSDTQYDPFAADYDWVFSDFRKAGDDFAAALGESLLPKLPSDPQILDCACGTGVLVMAMARLGYKVVGTDGSPGMIRQAKRHAAAEGLAVTLAACRWERLPRHFGPRFDLAVCAGNAIGHCRNEREMLRSLAGMRDVLRPGGRLLIGTRNWEKLLAEKVRWSSVGPRHRDGKRCVPLYSWTFPRAKGKSLTVEVVFPVEQDRKVSVSAYAVEYYPFGVESLLRRLRRVGFNEIQSNYTPNAGHYKVTCRKPEAAP